MRISVVLGTLLIAFSSVGAAQMRHLMAVATRTGMTLYNIDTAEVVCKYETENRPRQVSFSHNGRQVFIPVYSNTLLGKEGTNEHGFYMVSSRECRELARLDTTIFTRLHGVASTKSNMIYITAEQGKVVVAIDGVNQAIKAIIPTDAAGSHTITATPDDTWAFVSNVTGKSISVLDLPKKRLDSKIDLGSESQGIEFSPDYKTLLTTFWKDGKLAFVDVEKRTLTQTIDLGGPVHQAHYSKDGKFAYAVGNEGEEIAVYKVDLEKKAVAASVKSGIGKLATSFAINPWTNELYVSDQANNQIVILNPDDLKVVKKIDTDRQPDGIAFAASR